MGSPVWDGQTGPALVEDERLAYFIAALISGAGVGMPNAVPLSVLEERLREALRDVTK